MMKYTNWNPNTLQGVYVQYIQVFILTVEGTSHLATYAQQACQISSIGGSSPASLSYNTTTSIITLIPCQQELRKK